MQGANSTQRILQECLLKIELYLERLVQPNREEVKHKLIELANVCILKVKVLSQESLPRVYAKVKQFIFSSRNYWAFQLLDNLLKNHKVFHSLAQEDLSELFLCVFREHKGKNHKAIVNDMKIIWKTWTYVFDNKYLKNLKPTLLQQYQINLDDVSASDSAKIKEFVKKIEPEHNNMLDQVLDSDSN